MVCIKAQLSAGRPAGSWCYIQGLTRWCTSYSLVLISRADPEVCILMRQGGQAYLIQLYHCNLVLQLHGTAPGGRVLLINPRTIHTRLMAYYVSVFTG